LYSCITATVPAGALAGAKDAKISDKGRFLVKRYNPTAVTPKAVNDSAKIIETIPRDKLLYIEVKCGREIVRPLKKVLKTSDLAPEQVVIISFNSDAIKEAKRVLPGSKAYWITSFNRPQPIGKQEPTIDTILEVLNDCNADGLDCQGSKHIDEEFVGRLRSAGKEFHVWTINTIKHAKHFMKVGAESITTNRPGLVKEGVVRVKN